MVQSSAPLWPGRGREIVRLAVTAEDFGRLERVPGINASCRQIATMEMKLFHGLADSVSGAIWEWSLLLARFFSASHTTADRED